MMNDETLKALGKLVVGEPPRDAVHIAVVPVEASDVLLPGQRVSILEGRAVRAPDGGSTVGVVDPYLDAPVKGGERFWLFLNPGSITSLRHEWTHPALPLDMALAGQKKVSEAWLREFASHHYGISYDELVHAAVSGKGIVQWDSESLRDAMWEGGTKERFWRHIEVATGKSFSDEHRDRVYFSCTC